MPAADGGSPEGSSPEGGAPDGGPTSCAGQPFGAPVPANVAFASSFPALFSAPRTRNGVAYFAATTGGGAQSLHKSVFVPAQGAGAPSLAAPVQVLNASNPNEIEWSPAIARDASFLVFSRGFFTQRILWLALPGGTDFVTAAPIGALNVGNDQGEAWIAGATPKALYWGRATTTQTAIHRSAITVSPPSFAPAIALDLACPELNCGWPVVSDDETIMLFASWGGDGQATATVRETVLTPGGNKPAVGQIASHPNLGARLPSWISPDGCEVLLGNGLVSGVAYARRSPK